MSCNHNDECKDPCKDPCNTDPCYDNCGCLNPTTFECVTKPGNHHDIKVSNDMNGKQVISAINDKIAELVDTSGKIIIDHEDACPNSLVNKIEAGANVSIDQVGTGCGKKLVITAGTGIGPAGVDVNVKVSSTDTTSGFLNNKIEVGPFLQKVITGGIGNQKLRLDLGSISNLLSTDIGNALTIGSDSKLKTSYSIPDGSETKIQGSGAVTVTGNGTNANPYVIFTNPSIYPKKASFDGIWKPLNIVAPSGMIINSQDVSYRFRFDGTIEFKGRLTTTLTISTANLDLNSLFTFPVGGTNPIASVADITRQNVIKSVTTYSGTIFDIYNIYISNGKLGIKFTYTGTFSTPTINRTYIVDFDSATYHMDNI